MPDLNWMRIQGPRWRIAGVTMEFDLFSQEKSGKLGSQPMDPREVMVHGAPMAVAEERLTRA
jgi:hypothetical protein